MRCLRLIVLALGLTIVAPAIADDQDPRLGVLNQLVGRRFVGRGGEAQISTVGNDLFEVRASGDKIEVRISAQQITVKSSKSGHQSFDGTIRVGRNGFLVIGGRGQIHEWYFLLDYEGDLHVLYLQKKGDGYKLFSYAEFVDQARQGAAAATAKAASLFYDADASNVEAILGVSLAELPERLDIPVGRPTPPANVMLAATPPAQPTTLPSQPPPPARRAAIATGPRFALVIGNAEYGAAIGRLPNPVNDAQAVASALRSVGFEVAVVTNSDQRAMKRAIFQFGQRLLAAGRGATGLFYYAGHGLQSRGINYLIPVDAAIENEADVDLEAVAADTVLRQMEEAGAATNIVILDACRNMPIARSARDGSRGLARMEAPNGSFVAYSTAPGAVALDGEGSNSPFARSLVAEIVKPGQPIEVTFRNVRRDVIAASGGKQTPWDSSSLVDSFAFVP